MDIALSVGHASGTGARGNGLNEHEVCVDMARRVAELLRGDWGHRVDVLDFPELSNAEDLRKTVEAANNGRYDLGVSIHCDCAENKAARGGHVCFYPGSVKGGRLACEIAELLGGVMPGRAQWVVGRKELYVLRKTACPWALVECGFFSNEEDARMLREYPDKVAEAIARGIQRAVEKWGW